MRTDIIQLLTRSFLFLSLLSIQLVLAKPHIGDSQVAIGPDKNDMLNSNLRAWKWELLRRLSPDMIDQNGAMEYPMENEYANAEMKRQARNYRQCYFNPISCFRK